MALAFGQEFRWQGRVGRDKRVGGPARELRRPYLQAPLEQEAAVAYW